MVTERLLFWSGASRGCVVDYFLLTSSVRRWLSFTNMSVKLSTLLSYMLLFPGYFFDCGGLGVTFSLIGGAMT